MSKKAKTVGLYLGGALLGALFLFSGGVKLAGAPEMVANFQRWGFPGWFLTLTGAIEFASGLALFVPPAAFYGALLLVPTMIGATLTHLTHNEAAHAAIPAVLLVWAAAIAWARRPAVLRAGRPARPAAAHR